MSFSHSRAGGNPATLTADCEKLGTRLRGHDVAGNRELNSCPSLMNFSVTSVAKSDRNVIRMDVPLCVSSCPEADIDLLDRFLGHDAWTTRQLLDICSTLSEDQLDRDFDIGHRTLRRTLDHIIHNMETWSSLMAEQPFERAADQTIAGMIRRHDLAADRLKSVSRKIADSKAWDHLWPDHLDDPPQQKKFRNRHRSRHHTQHAPPRPAVLHASLIGRHPPPRRRRLQLGECKLKIFQIRRPENWATESTESSEEASS
jgi:uncharacterized damage-inducible protein DinB